MRGHIHENLQDDRMSDCHHHPSSQSRKISIGVMADSLANRRSRPPKEQGSTLANVEQVHCDLENPIERKRTEEGASTVQKEKQSQAPQRVESPWVSTRSFYQDTPITKTIIGTKEVFVSQSNCLRQRQSKVYGVKVAPAAYSIHVFAKQTSILESGDNKRKFDEVNYRMKGGKDDRKKSSEELTFATGQPASKVGTENEANITDNRTETLRVKLCEILGNVTSPKDQHSESQNHEQDTNKIFSQKDDKSIQSRQNSDTIETDSEGPVQNIGKPKTHSLTRKKAPTKKARTKKTKKNETSSHKFKHQQENIFNFEETLPKRLHAVASGGSSVFSRKKNEKRGFKMEPRKIFFPENNADEVDQATCRTETRVSDERTNTDKFHNCTPQTDRDYPGHGGKIQESLEQSPLTNNTKLPGDFNSLCDAQQQDDINSPLRNAMDPHHLQSPTFKVNTPGHSSSPSSSKKKDKMLHGYSSPGLAGRPFLMGDICSFGKLQTSKQGCYESNAKPESSDDMDECLKFSFRKAVPDISDGEREDGPLESSREQSFESSQEGSSERETISPEVGTIEKMKFIFHPAKRLRSNEAYEGPGQSTWIEEPDKQNEEDGLARAVKLFALELEKFKTKTKSAMVKKSSAILMSAAEGVQLQLQNVESHIQADVGKMTSLCKSKRKHLATRFEEQQNKLKLIHEKFKEEINRHLQDFRSTLEELEAQQIEIKGTVEKQKASHRNVLLQVEEAVDARLSDAHKRIAAIHELGRGKMFHLKQAIALCLKDGLPT